MELNKIKKELRWVKMSDLKPYGANPRHNNKSAKVVAESIKAYGYINPIIVTEDLMILAGHTRFKALKLLGVEEIDVLVIKGLTEQQIHGFVIADNRVGEFSTWNFSAMDRLLSKKEIASDTLKNLGMMSVADNKKELEDLIKDA